MSKKGIALFFVLATLFMVILLSVIVLNFIASQSKLSTHQVKRVQTHYAAQAGINYALEQLRLNNATWITNSTSTTTHRICGAAYSSSCTGDNFTEFSFPPLIRYVEIIVGPLLSPPGRQINATVNFTSD